VRTRIWATAGVLALALVSPAVAGCSVTKGSSSKPGGAAPTTSAPPAPQEELAASVKVFNDTPYHFTAADGEGMTVAGDVRPTDKAVQMTLKQHIAGAGQMTMRFLIVDPDYYVKISVPGLTLPGTENAHGRWLHVDPKKMGGMDQGLGRLGSGQEENGDPFDATTMVRNAATVEKVDDTHFKGTLDLTDVDGMTVDADLVKALGAKATSIPFTATVDSEHRLTAMKVTIPPVTGHKKTRVMTVTYSGFGQDTEVKKPTADQTMEAPAKLYQIFNG
jgi:hypothetical protein